MAVLDTWSYGLVSGEAKFTLQLCVSDPSVCCLPFAVTKGKEMLKLHYYIATAALLSRRHLQANCFSPAVAAASNRPYPRCEAIRHLAAKPKRGAIIDTYQTVSVNCAKCRLKLFRYKKKNGTKSNLIKLYVERIVEDCESVLDEQYTRESSGDEVTELTCPGCNTRFARSTTIKGLPALKLVGGKIRMTKK